MLALLLLPLAPLVSGHGGVVWPPIWQEGRDIALEDRRDHYAFTDPVSRDPNTNRAYESVKTWLTDQAYTGGHGDQFKGIGPVTNINKKALAKFDRCNRACVRDRQPWAAPGQAPTLGGGCGVFGGNPFGCPAHQDTRPPGSQCGQDKPAGRGKRGTSSFGSDARMVAFPQMLTTEWPVGSLQDVAWTSNGAHRGGYTYRLCKMPEGGRADISEDCFTKNVLEFATPYTMIRWKEGDDVTDWLQFNQTDLSEGTHPPGSTWRPVGIFYKQEVVVRKDTVVVPAGLAPGDYVLGWRWDGSGGHQVWVSCSSVRLVAPAGARADEGGDTEEEAEEEEAPLYTDEEYAELEEGFQY